MLGEEQRISSRRMGGVDQSKIGGSLEIEADVTGNTLETNKTVTEIRFFDEAR